MRVREREKDCEKRDTERELENNNSRDNAGIFSTRIYTIFTYRYDPPSLPVFPIKSVAGNSQ